MNRIIDFFKNLKFPKMGRPSVRQIIFWIAALALAGGSISLQIVSLHVGNLPHWTEFHPRVVTSVEPVCRPCSNAKGTPINPVTPTADVSVPVAQAPTWDGGSRINIIFFGFRAGATSRGRLSGLHRYDHFIYS